MPAATWTAAGIGRHQLEVNCWALEMGGHCRTGLEDNIRWDKTRLAASNAELVTRVAQLCDGYGRPVATPAEARRFCRCLQLEGKPQPLGVPGMSSSGWAAPREKRQVSPAAATALRALDKQGRGKSLYRPSFMYPIIAPAVTSACESRSPRK